jgi:hypothetical protein
MAEIDIGKIFAEYQIDKIFQNPPPISGPGKAGSSSAPTGSGTAPIGNQTSNGPDDRPIDFGDAASTAPIATSGAALSLGGGDAPYAPLLTSDVEPLKLGSDHGWPKSGLFGDDPDWYLI